MKETRGMYATTDIGLTVIGPSVIDLYRLVVSAGDEILAESMPSNLGTINDRRAGIDRQLWTNECHCGKVIKFVYEVGYETGELVVSGVCAEHYAEHAQEVTS